MAHTSTCGGCGQDFDFARAGTGTICEGHTERQFCPACWPAARDAWLDEPPEPLEENHGKSTDVSLPSN